MRIIRSTGVVAGLFAILFMAGCGETYRPVVIPLPNPGGDPQTGSIVIVGNQGVHVNHAPTPDGTPCDETNTGPGISCPGSVTAIDVPGDVNYGNHVVGENPWTAALYGSAVITANKGNNTLSSYSPTNALIAPLTISMPVTVPAKVDATTTTDINVAPVNYIATTLGTVLFTTMPACGTLSGGICTAIDKTSPGVMAVVINTAFSQAFQVGNNPVAAVGLPDASKVYVLNEGSDTVTAFAQSDRTRVANISGFQGPVYAVPSPKSGFLFVFNRDSGTVGVVKTSNDTLILSPSFGSPIPVPVSDLPPSHPMFYDTKKDRLWVANPVDNTVTVFDASQLAANGTMPMLNTVHLPASSVAPFAITVLSDGSKAYVVSAGAPKATSPVAASVSVIDANSFVANQISGYIGVSPLDIVSSLDGTKVYIVNHDPSVIPSPDASAPAGSTIIVQQPGTNIITTKDNSFLKDNNGAIYTIVAPFQDIVNCTIDTPQPWIPGYDYKVNASMVPRTPNGHAYRTTVAGRSGAADPAFCTTNGCTFTDGGVTWLEMGAPRSCPRQRPNFAAAQ